MHPSLYGGHDHIWGHTEDEEERDEEERQGDVSGALTQGHILPGTRRRARVVARNSVHAHRHYQTVISHFLQNFFK